MNTNEKEIVDLNNFTCQVPTGKIVRWIIESGIPIQMRDDRASTTVNLAQTKHTEERVHVVHVK